VLVAVPVVLTTGEKLDEVHLQCLAQEVIVTRPDHPPGPRLPLVRVARVADARVVGDGAGLTHAVDIALLLSELPEPVGLRAEAAQERALVLTHGGLLRSSLLVQWYDVSRARQPRASSRSRAR